MDKKTYILFYKNTVFVDCSANCQLKRDCCGVCLQRNVDSHYKRIYRFFREFKIH